MGTRIRPRTRTRSAAIASCFATLALFASACSGGSSSTDGENDETSYESASDEGKASDDHARMEKCLRDKGINVNPEKGKEQGAAIGGGQVSKEAIQKALQECSQRGPDAGPAEVSQADKDRILKYAQCMRKNGYNMPDPEFEGGLMKAPPPPKEIEREKFEKAAVACESIIR